MVRQLVESGTEWEAHVGYSRAVRAGDQIHVSGTTPVDDEGEVVGETPYEQTAAALEIVEGALDEVDAGLEDVVRTRMYVTDADDWEEVGAVHADFFGDVRPAATIVEVSGLVGPEYVVEIEAEAVVPPERRSDE